MTIDKPVKSRMPSFFAYNLLMNS